MIKKRTSMFNVMTSVAMALMLFLSMAPAAFAVSATPPPTLGTESEPARAAITKIVKTPVNTKSPNATFQFDIQKVRVNGATPSDYINEIPHIGTVDVNNTTHTSTVNINFTASTRGSTNNGITTYVLQTSSPQDIFANINWPNAGVYEYRITERLGGTTDEGTTDGVYEKMTYSSASYDVAVYVANGTNGLYVSGIGAKIDEKDDSNSSSNKGDKVDTTPGPDENPNIDGAWSKMAFTNSYMKNYGGTDPVTETVLNIGKTVTGSYGGHNQPFEFTVKVTKPNLAVVTQSTFKAYVLDSDGAVVTDTGSVGSIYASNVKQDAKGKYIEFTSGSSIVVKLTHGQKLSFVDLPVGTGVFVSEKGTPEYTPKLVAKFGVDGKEHVLEKTSGAPIATTDIDDLIPVAYTAEGKNANNIMFFNNHGGITPAGINIDNLPYIAMIVMAVFALAAYLTIQYRKTLNSKYFYV